MIGRDQSGFTLIELLLSLAVISVIAATSMPVFVAFQNQNDIHTKGQEVASMLRRAQMYARAGNEDSAWSVAIQSGSATLFKGTVFATRDTTADETSVLAGPIVPSGLTLVSFSKLTGDPSSTGTVTLTSGSYTRSISINSEGMVSY